MRYTQSPHGYLFFRVKDNDEVEYTLEEQYDCDYIKGRMQIELEKITGAMKKVAEMREGGNQPYPMWRFDTLEDVKLHIRPEDFLKKNGVELVYNCCDNLFYRADRFSYTYYIILAVYESKKFGVELVKASGDKYIKLSDVYVLDV